MPTTISKLKKKLDKVFSEFIRRRNADHLGFINCFTCGVKKHWKEQQAGHFQSRSHHSTRWDEVNVQVQCIKCNIHFNSIITIHILCIYNNTKLIRQQLDNIYVIKLTNTISTNK